MSPEKVGGGLCDSLEMGAGRRRPQQVVCYKGEGGDTKRLDFEKKRER